MKCEKNEAFLPETPGEPTAPNLNTPRNLNTDMSSRSEYFDQENISFTLNNIHISNRETKPVKKKKEEVVALTSKCEAKYNTPRPRKIFSSKLHKLTVFDQENTPNYAKPTRSCIKKQQNIPEHTKQHPLRDIRCVRTPSFIKTTLAFQNKHCPETPPITSTKPIRDIREIPEPNFLKPTTAFSKHHQSKVELNSRQLQVVDVRKENKTPNFMRETQSCLAHKSRSEAEDKQSELSATANEVRDIRLEREHNFAKKTAATVSRELAPKEDGKKEDTLNLRPEVRNDFEGKKVKDIRKDPRPHFLLPTKAFTARKPNKRESKLKARRIRKNFNLTAPNSPFLFTKKRQEMVKANENCRNRTNSTNTGISAKSTYTGKPTIAKSFSFETDSRSRKTSYKSRDEQEEEYMASLKPFKARKFNVEKTVINSIATKTHKKLPTRSASFHLRTANRSRPLRNAFTVRVNAPKIKKSQETAMYDREMKRKQILSERREEEASREVIEEKLQRNFKAQPLPDFSARYDTATCQIKHFKPTRPITPVVLQRTELTKHYLNQLKIEEQIELKENAIFKAKALPRSTYEASALPRVQKRINTRAVSVRLKSDERALERKLFDEKIKRDEYTRQIQKDKALTIDAKREREEIAELRKKLVHKPLPLPYEHAKGGSNSVCSSLR
eukprot:maker-scaffold_20-snap-gene-2.6-mRNA-1 protein AED:0.00 eAED:0.00 QI:52/1/1/1/1/1/2/167/670